MTLTPEQKAAGWIEWNGGRCPIKDDRTRVAVMLDGGQLPLSQRCAKHWIWEHRGWGSDIIAYRIIEAHGADAAPARPTPFPASYDDLVFDADGWSQTIIVDGKRPEWLRDDDRCACFTDTDEGWTADLYDGTELAVRVRRREPKRETVRGYILSHYINERPEVVFDLIDGKPDLSTLRIVEGEA